MVIAGGLLSVWLILIQCACGGGPSDPRPVHGAGRPPSLYYPDSTQTCYPGTGIRDMLPAIQWNAYPGSASPSSFTASPALPAGLKLDAQTGAISGTPTLASPLPMTGYSIQAQLDQVGPLQTGIYLSVLNDAAKHLSVHRTGHSALPLPSGKVLFSGGLPTSISGGLPVGTWDALECFDPVSGNVSPTGGGYEFTGGTATLLPGGKVLFCPGFGNKGTLYDPATGIFTATGNSASTEQRSYTATLLADGNVLLLGAKMTGAGYYSGAYSEVYLSATGLFAPANAQGLPRTKHTSTLLADGRVLIVGGDSGLYTPQAMAELFDPATGRFTATGSLITARMNHSATRLPDGRVLILGGTAPSSTGGSSLSSAELYDPATGRFSAAGDLGQGMDFPVATLLLTGKVLVISGSTAVLFDPLMQTSSLTGSCFQARRGGASATLMPSGSVLVVGGSSGSSSGGVLTAAEWYDPAAGTFKLNGL